MPDGTHRTSKPRDDGEHGEGHEHHADEAHEHGDGHGHDQRAEDAHDLEHDHEHDHPTGLRGFVLDMIRPHSHDSADSIDTALESSSLGIRAVKISLAALMVTALLQVILVVVTNSVALLADTIHNFSDALTSVPLWIAFVLGRRAATRTHTFGYRRAEDLAGLFIVAMIAFSAILAAWESINRLINPHPISNVGLVVAAGIIGFAGNELVASYRIRTGKRIGSAALIADGYHARTDGFTSLAVVFGAVGVMLGFPQADPIVGLLITVAILFVLKGAVRQVFGRLMDAVDPSLVELVQSSAAAVPGVEGVSGIRLRWIGHRLDAAMHVTVDCDMTVADGHRVGEEVRHVLLHTVKGMDRVIVHLDPCGHDGQDAHVATAHHAELDATHIPNGANSP